MERRTFLAWVGVGLLASSLPVAIAACSSDQAESEGDSSPTTGPAANPGTTDAAPREDGFIVAGPVTDLEAKGYFIKKLDKTRVIVVRSPEGSDNLVALNAKCTHQGCPVTWKAAEKLLFCDCHGSKFNLDGTVANGPADAPLTTVTAKTEADLVLVNLS